MLHYTSYRSHIKKRFGKPVLKIPVNGGFSCPNRDGTIGTQGCLFCDNRSFSPVAETGAAVFDQVSLAMEKTGKGYDAFIAYFQPYSNTYGDATLLSSLYEPVIRHSGVVGLAVGTRPDCFTEEVYDYLQDVSERTYLSVEIGLQSGSDETLRFNNRGHTVDDFKRAVLELFRRGIETVAHVMIGLPPETRDQTIQTAILLASLPVTGIKIHQLMIIKDTPLENLYNQGKVSALTLEDYADILCDFLAHLRPDQHIHRIMADASVSNGLVAPLWSADKGRSINYIHEVMDKVGLVQGSAFRKK